MAFSKLEKQKFKQGFKLIAGVDEVGYGSLAGPVTVALVCYSGTVPKKLGTVPIRDSKQLSQKQREEIFEIVNQEPDLEWKVSFVQSQVIDKINILRASQLAGQRCFNKLKQRPGFLFLDGSHILPRLKIKQEAIVAGDSKILLVALASIMAKVSRDRLMEKLDLKYPGYEFALHKGYGTKLHLEKLKKLGPCQIHRKSFFPIKKSLLLKEKAI